MIDMNIPDREKAEDLIQRFEDLFDELEEQDMIFVGTIMLVHRDDEDEPNMMGLVQHCNTNKARAVDILNNHIDSIENDSAEPKEQVFHA